MVHPFTIEPGTYTAFANEAEQIEKCKEWGLLSEKASKAKMFLYKGYGMNLACSIVGFVDKITAVIEFDNKQQHCIHPSYLKEMQASNYGQKAAAAVEEPAVAEDKGLDAAETKTAVAVAAKPGPEPAEPKAAVAVAAKPELEVAEHEAVQADQAPAAEAELQEETAGEEPPKGKAKKEKAQKLQLPEDKVKMRATVKEFTTVPNNFSDNDDEVIIYDAVSIEQPETAIGTAWSSHSATLKKLELEIGDTIVFEGKIVAKKLTKHPVPYKINNPAKIQKEP